MAGLSNREIMIIVNKYIGVSSGYLGDFSYNSHAEFYPLYCDLDINPFEYQGTTRERFIQILSSTSPKDQAKILRGVLDRFPISDWPPTRNEGLREQISQIISRLETESPIASPNPQITNEVVERAIADAETLIQTNGATSAIDRIHTALHGYLQAACDSKTIIYPSGATLPVLLKLLRQQHPALQKIGPRSQDIEHILNASGAILNALNPLRNQASVAHPNQNLLAKEEALLVINIARTLLHYIDSKLR